MRRKIRYVVRPEHIWTSIAHMARIQEGELLKTQQQASSISKTSYFIALSQCYSRKSV